MLKEWLLNLLYPPRCPGCGTAVSRHGQWCFSCFGAVWRPRRLQRKRGSRLAACYCLCDYRGPVRTMLQRLKYDGAVRYERAAEELLMQFPWPEQLRHIDCVVPVPLAPEKERKRGFNQSEVLFRSWAERCWPWKNGLQRVRSTQAQWHLDKADRADNVKRAFEVKGSFDVRGKHILLVDDIYTTGTTMEACAYALHKKGAASVTGFVVASGAL